MQHSSALKKRIDQRCPRRTKIPDVARHDGQGGSIVAGLASGTRTISARGSICTCASFSCGNLDLGLSLRGWNLVRTLYGTAEESGGPDGNGGGTIFTYTLDSKTFTILHVFAGGSEGSSPEGGLANNETNYFITGQPQYGVTSDNGAFGLGVVYEIGSSGVPVVRHAFTGGTDGGVPRGRLTRFIDGNYLSPSGDFADIHDFSPTEGGNAIGGLVVYIIAE